jgi:hypothetical protein
VPGDSSGRPGRGGRSNAQGQGGTSSVRRDILAALASGEAVTWPELAARLEARGVQVEGEESVALRQDPAAVLWSGWRPEAIDALLELVAADRVVLERCPSTRYRGAHLDLPIAPERRPDGPLAAPCWLPVTLRLAWLWSSLPTDDAHGRR